MKFTSEGMPEFNLPQYADHKIKRKRERKRGQATFLPAFVASPRLSSIDMRPCTKYEKKAACPLFPSQMRSETVQLVQLAVGAGMCWSTTGLKETRPLIVQGLLRMLRG